MEEIIEPISKELLKAELTEEKVCLLSIGDAYTAGAFVYACLQMPPGTFCSGGSHSVPVLSDQQLDLHHTSDIPLP